MGKTTVSEIVSETCAAIWETMNETYLPYPTTETWRDIAMEYNQKWNFPNCLGSIDGKHIRIKCPEKSGSLYYNYKNFFPSFCKELPTQITNLLLLMLERMVERAMEEYLESHCSSSF